MTPRVLRRSSEPRGDRLTEDRKSLIERYAADAAETEAQTRRAAEARVRRAVRAQAQRIVVEERARLAVRAEARRIVEEQARSAATAAARRIIAEEKAKLAADELRSGSVASFPRVLTACAAYRGRFGRWPTEMRVHPLDLRDLARLSSERWYQVAHRVVLTSDWTVVSGPAVRGAEGEVRCDDGIVDDDRRVADADVEEWLLSAPTEPIRE
jgi:hypothetical protein